MTGASMGNLDFDDMLRYVDNSVQNKPGALKFNPGKPELQNSMNVIAPSPHNLSERGTGVKRGGQSKSQKRHDKKSRTTYESDDDAQIAVRLARLRRDVLERQEDVEEEEVVNGHDNTQLDDGLERLRSFRESLGISEPPQQRHSRAKPISKRRYSACGDKHLGMRKEFDTPAAEVSEAQLLQRLQKLRQSLSSPERSKTSKVQQRTAKKKRLQYNSAERLPTNITTSMSAELFSAVAENPQAHDDASMLQHLQGVGVSSGLANNHQQWAMDLNNVMRMGFTMERGGQVDQFVGHDNQYAQ